MRFHVESMFVTDDAKTTLDIVHTEWKLLSGEHVESRLAHETHLLYGWGGGVESSEPLRESYKECSRYHTFHAYPKYTFVHIVPY